MTASTVNIELDAGTDTNIQFDWTDPSTNLPINLTGYTSRMQIRTVQYGVPVILELTTENSKIVLGGAAGTIIVKFDPEDTNEGSWFRGTYDLYITNTGTGEVSAVARGFVTVLPQTTL